MLTCNMEQMKAFRWTHTCRQEIKHQDTLGLRLPDLENSDDVINIGPALSDFGAKDQACTTAQDQADVASNFKSSFMAVEIIQAPTSTITFWILADRCAVLLLLRIRMDDSQISVQISEIRSASHNFVGHF